MKKIRKKEKKLRMDYKGNALLTATWGTLRIPKHLTAYGDEDTPARGKKALLILLVIMLIVVSVLLVVLALSRAV